MDAFATGLPRRRRTSTAVAALVAAAACWGLGAVVSKQVIDAVTPLTLLSVRGHRAGDR